MKYRLKVVRLHSMYVLNFLIQRSCGCKEKYVTRSWPWIKYKDHSFLTLWKDSLIRAATSRRHHLTTAPQRLVSSLGSHPYFDISLEMFFCKNSAKSARAFSLSFGRSDVLPKQASHTSRMCSTAPGLTSRRAFLRVDSLSDEDTTAARTSASGRQMVPSADL
jgi:hypothetical protein